MVNLNASPYSIGRRLERLRRLEERVAEAGCAIGYVNQVGGQDELVFDGGSVVVDARGRSSPRRRNSRKRCSSPTSRFRREAPRGPHMARSSSSV